MRKMKIAILVVLLVVVSLNSVWAWDIDFAQAKRAMEENSAFSETQDYTPKFLEFIEEKFGARTKKCTPMFFKKETIIILIIGDSNTVEHVLAAEESFTVRCFRHEYLYQEVPTPPYTPFYIEMKVK